MAKSAEEAALVDDMGKVYKITKKFVNTNTKADSPVLDLNGHILSTDEEKLNECSEHFESALNHVVSSDVPPFAPTTETISPAKILPQTPSSKPEIVAAIKSLPYVTAAAVDGMSAEFYRSNWQLKCLNPFSRSLVERGVS